MNVSKYFRFQLSPWVNYKKTNSEYNFLNGTFNGLLSTDYKATLDSLNSPFWNKTFVNIIRRNMESAIGNNQIVKAGVPVWVRFSIPGIDKQKMIFDANVDFYNQKQNEYNRFTYNYYENATLNTDYRNRFDNLPKKGFNLSTKLTHIWEWNFYTNLKTSYSFTHKYSSGDQMRYRLDKLEESTDKPLGWHPDNNVIADVLDVDNSYKSILRLNQHAINLRHS